MKIKPNIKCCFGFHDWVVYTHPIDDHKKQRHCNRCNKDQETGYDDDNYIMMHWKTTN